MPLTLPGIKVSLRLSDSPSKEEIPLYKPETINSGTVAGFVPSEAGQSFEVWVNNTMVSGEGLVYTTFIDGREMYRFCIKPFQNSCMKGVYTPAGVLPFTFAKLQLKEDDGEAPSFDLSKLGLIEIQVCRATIRDNHEPITYHQTDAKASLDPVSEKAKKVGWHSVSLGAVKPPNNLTATYIDYIDPLSKPYAFFRFRYKPQELLEDEGIAPQTERPKQPAPGDKRPRPEDDADARPNAKRPANENVKPEPTEGSVGGSQRKVPKVEGAKKVKSEGAMGDIIDLTNRGHSPIHVPVKGEVIDLSDD
ncbi:hypothetical protein PENSPDRAFT_754471 [Peniophora sp. CONT]|nr:hypothetical protein PENSPDRAFT_754471 [Peniophora sp. CONT]